MNKSFPPNIDPQLFCLTAVAVSVALIDDFTANELNSIANWILLVGQYLDTAAAQQMLIEGRIDKYNININSQYYKKYGNPYMGMKKSNQYYRDEVDMLLYMVDKMQKEIEKIKKENE